MSRYERYNTTRNGVPVAVEHRDRDYHGPGYHEFEHEYRETDLYDEDRERERTRDKELTRYYHHENRSSGALVPVRQEKIIERDLYEVPPEPEPIIPIREIELDNTIKVTEHEHEHVHHHQHIHIDHGSIHIVAEKPAPPPPRKEINERETLIQIRERRYGGKWNATGRLSLDAGNHAEHAHEHHSDFHHEDHHHHHSRSRSRSQSREREVKRTIGYGRYRESPRGSTGALVNPSPRGSGFFKDFKAEQEGWTVVDVPGSSNRRITLEGSASADISFGNAPIRRSSKQRDRTAQGELWTEITKDLVCAEALEEFNLQFEETDSFVYVFDYLHREQIQDLIELTKDIRRGKLYDFDRRRRRSSFSRRYYR